MDKIALLEAIHSEIDELGLNPTNYNVFDDDDLEVFALQFLLANLSEAFEPKE